MTLQAEIASVQSEIERIKERLQEKIKALPDNQLINRSAGASCFVVQSSNLLDNWTPEFHDFRSQYELITKEIASRRTESAIPLLRRINAIFVSIQLFAGISEL